jgi:hypothetical protein
MMAGSCLGKPGLSVRYAEGRRGFDDNIFTVETLRHCAFAQVIYLSLSLDLGKESKLRGAFVVEGEIKGVEGFPFFRSKNLNA